MPISALESKIGSNGKPQLPKTSARGQASLSKSKLKTSASLKKLNTTRGSSSSQALEASGNLTSRLLKERGMYPSESKSKTNFLAQYINSSADSNKTTEERFDNEPAELQNLLRKLQPASTKNLRAPEKGSAFKFTSTGSRSGSA